MSEILPSNVRYHNLKAEEGRADRARPDMEDMRKEISCTKVNAGGSLGFKCNSEQSATRNKVQLGTKCNSEHRPLKS